MKDAGEQKADLPDEVLSRTIAALIVFKRYAPRTTVSGCVIFMEIARRGLKSHVLDLPNNAELSNLTDTSKSAVGHLIASMTPKGRARAGRPSPSDDDGFGLIETNDWLQGRRVSAYVLTEKGRACLQEMVQALAGDQPIEPLRPHDMNSLFKLALIDAGGRND